MAPRKKKNDKPSLRVTKKGTRYVLYKGKRFRVMTTAPDKEIIKRLDKIIHELKKKKTKQYIKRKRQQAKIEHKNPVMTGSSGPEQKDVTGNEFFKHLIANTTLLGVNKNQTIQGIDHTKQSVNVQPKTITFEGKERKLIDYKPDKQVPADKDVIEIDGKKFLVDKEVVEQGKKLQESTKKAKQKVVQKELDILKLENESMLNKIHKESVVDIAGILLLDPTKDGKRVDTKDNIIKLIQEENPEHVRSVLDDVGVPDFLHTATLKKTAPVTPINPPLTRAKKKQKEDEDLNAPKKVEFRDFIEEIERTMTPNRIERKLDFPAETSSEEEQDGKGKTGKGLWNYEIDNFMRNHAKNGFKGTFAIDQLDKIQLNKSDTSFSFIMNTEPLKVSHGHWQAWFITPNTIEHYDSFGEEPNPHALEVIMKKLRKWRPNAKYQLKINNVKHQKVTSDNCGFFAMRFLRDRFSGKTFKEATGFNIIEKSIKNEKQIKQFKDMVEDFGIVY
eukprot:Lithocolla_globosa_v1_NODE_2843_length_1850_cov_299.708635.p1 type:complete len:502 gc:universal NODE_2843_length_1850_cov_299.708635:1563-58(-)